MSWISPESLDRARAHAGVVAARVESAGLRSRTASSLRDALAGDFPPNERTGWLVMPPGLADRLRAEAAELEGLLRARGFLQLGGADLAALRYVLSEGVVG